MSPSALTCFVPFPFLLTISPHTSAVSLLHQHSPLTISYLGEFTLQFGPALLALPSLPPSPYKSIVFISPLFSYLLLRYASGVPPLEKSGEKKWGKDPEWRKYVEGTSVLVPWPMGLGKGKAAWGEVEREGDGAGA
jgi:hypothetical protein